MENRSRIIIALMVVFGAISFAPLAVFAHNTYPHATCDAPPAAPSGYTFSKTIMLPHDQKLYNYQGEISGPYTNASNSVASGEYRVRLASSEDSMLPEQITEMWTLAVKNSAGSFIGSWTTPDLPSNVLEKSWELGTLNVPSGQTATTFVASFAGQVNNSVVATCAIFYKKDTVVTPPPAPAPTADIKANGSDNPITVNSTDTFVLSWTSSNADYCTATGSWSGSRAISGQQNKGSLPVGSYTYFINCYNATGSDYNSVVVNVVNNTSPPAPQVDIKANGSDAPSPIAYNTSANLTWTSSNAVSCTASGDWSGSKSLNNTSGQSTGNLTSQKSYTITCTNSVGVTRYDEVTVPVQGQQQLPTVILTANPSNVNQGQTSTLTWNSTNATSCYTSGGPWSQSGTLPVVDGSQVSQALYNQSNTFSVTCTNAQGQTDSAQTVVTVNQNQDVFPTADIKANGSDGPVQVAQNSQPTITWTSGNAVSCESSGGPWSGSRSISGTFYPSVPSTFNYTWSITCRSSSGHTASDTVNVYTGGTSNNAPTVYINANPNFVNYGSSSTLTWGSSYANSCSAGGGWNGSKGTSGSESTGALYNNQTYTITCTGSNGQTAQAQTTVSVGGQTYNNPPTLTIYAEPSPVQYGTGSTVRWSSTGTDVCYATSDWFGTKPVSGSMPTGPLYTDKTYTLTCTGQYGSITRSATVPVVGVPVVRGVTTYVLETPVTYNYSAEINKVVRNIRSGERSNNSSIMALPGDELEYVITVNNTGTGNLSALKVTDKLTDKVRAISVADGGIYNWQTNTMSWNIGSISAGRSKDLSFRVVVVSSACETEMLIENIAELSNSKIGTVRSSYAALASSNPSTIGGYPFLISINNPSPAVDPGDEVKYTVDYRNNGGEIVSDAILSVILPAGMQVKGHSRSATLKGNTVTLDIGSIRPGESGKVDVILEVSDDVISGEQLVTIAVLNYRTSQGNQSSTSQAMSTVAGDNTNLGASAGESEGTRFLPKDFFGWLLLLLLIIVIAVFIRRLFQE